MKLQDSARQAGALLLVIYVIGIIIAEAFFVLMARLSCMKNEGWTGLFWCPDALIAAIFTAFFKALVWPILFFNWISN